MKLLTTIKEKNKGIGFVYASKIAAVNGLSKNAKQISPNRMFDSNEITVYQNKENAVLRNTLKTQAEAHLSQKTYKGIRYSKALPARGQRTHTNAQTARRLRQNLIHNNDQK